ncbi:hypothetical protein [Marasmitruncus massiliensis]|uniref:hypothetical protein n=1 Tax=Marasmitruncus massiliensis TaxID=1944642 RepID=UPI000C7BF393|nr:hypothetical protein [Marasmitruncus massiliensis]
MIKIYIKLFVLLFVLIICGACHPQSQDDLVQSSISVDIASQRTNSSEQQNGETINLWDFTEKYGDLEVYLDSDILGGVYIGDDQRFHIKTTDIAQMEADVKSLKEQYYISDEVIIEPCQYTYNELTSAIGRINTRMNDLDINILGTDVMANGIVVGSPEWNDAKKSLILDLAQIDHVQFLTNSRNQLD